MYDGYIVAVIGEYCWCNLCVVIEVIVFQYIVVVQYVCVFFFVFGDIVQYVIVMWEVDQWVEVSLWIENVVCVNVFNVCQNFLFKCGFVFCWNEDVGVIGIYLIGVEEVCYYGDIGGEIEICIIENDQW